MRTGVLALTKTNTHTQAHTHNRDKYLLHVKWTCEENHARTQNVIHFQWITVVKSPSLIIIHLNLTTRAQIDRRVVHRIRTKNPRETAQTRTDAESGHPLLWQRDIHRSATSFAWLTTIIVKQFLINDVPSRQKSYRRPCDGTGKGNGNRRGNETNTGGRHNTGQ